MNTIVVRFIVSPLMPYMYSYLLFDTYPRLAAGDIGPSLRRQVMTRSAKCTKKNTATVARSPRGDNSPLHLSIPSQVPKRKSNRPSISDMRLMTVYPNEAPNVTIKNQVPTLEAAPNAPLCSLEKKK